MCKHFHLASKVPGESLLGLWVPWQKAATVSLAFMLIFMLYPRNEHKFVFCSVTVFFLTLKMFFPKYLQCLFIVFMCSITLFCICPKICIPHFDRHKLQCLEFLFWANSLGKVLKVESVYFTKERWSSHNLLGM